MRVAAIATLALAAALGGCASLNTLDSDVSTYSQWPAARKATTFAFERLPSQQARAQEQAELEALARPALLDAGFKEVANLQDADTSVQVAARVARTDRLVYNDPFWWRGGMYYSRLGRPFWGPGHAFAYDHPHYDREVAVLIRDRKTNQPLYEARATSDGMNNGGAQVFGAMFRAALKDFPQTGVNPRRVTVQLGPSP